MRTIVALSTPTGESAIGVIRLSGPNVMQITTDVFSKQLKPRYAHRVAYKNLNGDILDDAVATYFKAPASYTGEDCLEIATHGNPFIIQSIISDLIARGAEPAQAGEFTRKAFENGKIDLSQAEAVALLIQARSTRSLKAAQKQLSGELGKRINNMSEKLLDALALMEAYIDFPEDDLPAEDQNVVISAIESCTQNMSALIETAKFSPLVHQGIDIVIAGAPNAGKSSLLNLLLDDERAIVSDIAGTTRDFISEKTSIDGFAVNLTDTAGLRGSSDKLEAIGIDRARAKISGCDICLFVVDVANPNLTEFDTTKLLPENTIIVLNKCDIQSANPSAISQQFDKYTCVNVSCATQSGAVELRNAISKLINTYHITAVADDILVSARHAQSLQTALNYCNEAVLSAKNNAAAELTASDIREALNALGDIVGKTDNEAVLDRIFSKFCIGK